MLVMGPTIPAAVRGSDSPAFRKASLRNNDIVIQKQNKFSLGCLDALITAFCKAKILLVFNQLYNFYFPCTSVFSHLTVPSVEPLSTKIIS